MQRWIWTAVAILLLSIAVPIARSSGPWTAAATRTDRTLVFDTHHELRPTSIYSDEENAEMAGQLDLVEAWLDPQTYRELVSLVRFPEAPNAGVAAPDFELARTDGKPLRLSDLRGRIAVFMFAAMTSPPARMQVPRLEELQRVYGTRDVEFFLVYSRDRQPGKTDDTKLGPAQTFERKLESAQQLDALTTLPVAVDGVDEAVLELYGGVPNSAWVIDREGTIVFRSTWADSRKLSQVVDRLIRFERRSHS